MKKIGIIIGSSFLDDSDFKKYNIKVVSTDYGKVKFKFNKNIYYLQRHSKGTPPHMINYRAHIQAFKKLKINNIIALNSCASLKKNIQPGTIILPHDYIDLLNQHSFFHYKINFTIPSLSDELRQKIIKVARGKRIKILEQGVYWQTRGPRLETKAEIKMMTQYADLVGMTMASEATLARELNLDYASICSVDNYAHGIGDTVLTIKELHKGQKRMQDKLKEFMAEVIKIL